MLFLLLHTFIFCVCSVQRFGMLFVLCRCVFPLDLFRRLLFPCVFHCYQSRLVSLTVTDHFNFVYVYMAMFDVFVDHRRRNKPFSNLQFVVVLLKFHVQLKPRCASSLSLAYPDADDADDNSILKQNSSNPLKSLSN